ncbi:MAG: hypothetical protein B7X99_05945 [Rhizobiales bacterium 17-65-6]|nr:MAG: hypothetical protein B7Y84_11260 [Azorhizobium sp. 32-67-21]OYZ99951.1 MAG: hypothetical protein B7X99_05945 [Rhizobiales bacterium 17-65-6]
MSLPVLAFAALAALTVGAAAAPAGLDAYRWKARPLVVIAPDAADSRYRTQMEAVSAVQAALRERDMVVLPALGPDSPLRKQVGSGSAAFQVVLIGKDGHVAGRWTAPVALPDVFALIDRMPMRRDEMRRQGQ